MNATNETAARRDHVQLVAADLRKAGFHGLTVTETSVVVWRSGRPVWTDEVLDALADLGDEGLVVIHQRPARTSSTGLRIPAAVLVEVA